jgi:hypothetical protein
MLRLTHVFIVSLLAPGLVSAQDDKAAEKKKQIETQTKQALELWLTLEKKPNVNETNLFLLFGPGGEKELEALGKSLERAFTTLKKTAELKPNAELWPGKVVVHVCKEGTEFRNFYVKLKKEAPEKGEQGVYSHERDATVLLLAPAEARRHSVEAEAVIQLAAATLTKKAGRLPEWFVMGFARANAYRHVPQQFTAERQRTRQSIRQGRTAKDVWTNNLGADEGPALSASFFDFLMNSPQLAKTWPSVLGSMGEESMFEDVLKSAKLNPDQVDAAWRVWAGR